MTSLPPGRSPFHSSRRRHSSSAAAARPMSFGSTIASEDASSLLIISPQQQQQQEQPHSSSVDNNDSSSLIHNNGSSSQSFDLTSNNNYNNTHYNLKTLVVNLIARGAAMASNAVFYSQVLYHQQVSSRSVKEMPATTATQILSPNQMEIVILYARALSLLDSGGGSARAVQLLQKHHLLVNISSKPPTPNSLALPYYYEAALITAQYYDSQGDWEDAVAILENIVGDADLQNLSKPHNDDNNNDIHLLAQVCCMKGKFYDKLGNTSRGVDYLKTALRLDSRCIEAFDYLIEKHLLTIPQERQLVESLSFVCGSWMEDYYCSRLNTLLDGCSNSSFSTDHHNQDAYNESDRSGGASSRHSTTQKKLHFDTLNTSSGSSAPGQRINQEQTAAVSTDKNIEVAVASDDKILRRLVHEHGLSECAEVWALAAKKAYSMYRYSLAEKLYTKAYQLDSLFHYHYHFGYISTLIALERKQDLFLLAHTLIKSHSQQAVSWFAVASYYYVCQKYEMAQRYYGRAARLDPRNPEVWIGFGSSFAATDESDAALAAFRHAQKFNGGSIPLLNMGVEYVRTNHLSLAEHCFHNAAMRNPSDPMVYHELGVCFFKQSKFIEAIEQFTQALKLVHKIVHIEYLINERSKVNNPSTNMMMMDNDNTHPHNNGDSGTIISDEKQLEFYLDACRDPEWEPTITNLGHAFRKTRKFNLATKCFTYSLSLVTQKQQHMTAIPSPGASSSRTSKCSSKLDIEKALAYTHQLAGNVNSAIEWYHRALRQKSDDAFCNEMLPKVLEDSLTHLGDDLDSIIVGRRGGDRRREGSDEFSMFSERKEEDTTTNANNMSYCRSSIGTYDYSLTGGRRRNSSMFSRRTTNTPGGDTIDDSDMSMG